VPFVGTIRGRLVLTYLLLISLCLATVSVFFLNGARASLKARALSQMAVQSRTYAHFMDTYVFNEEDLPDAVRQLLKEFVRTRATIVFADSRGQVLGVALPEGSGGTGPERLDPTALQALRGMQVEYATEGGRRLHVATPIEVLYPEKRAIGVVDVSSELGELDEAYAELSDRLVMSLAVALAASVLAALLLARTLTRPILRIRQAASRIAEGHLEERVEASGAHELQELGVTINHMAEQLAARLGELVSERNRMRTLLASLPDPVAALDAEGRITYLNPAAESTLGLGRDEATGRTLPEVWPGAKGDKDDAGSALLPLLELDPKVPASRDLKVGERHFRGYMVPYRVPPPEGTPGRRDDAGTPGRLLVLRDMTDIRRLEEVRNLFLGSVSHELRTPLQIIKGFVVTLMDHPFADDEVRHYLQTIDRETDRLTRLVKDLIELSRLRSARLSLELAPAVPEEVLAETLNQLAPAAERKGVTVEYQAPPSPQPLPLDRDRFKQVALNLLDNALKYTPPQGRVRVSTRLEGETWVMEVADDGPGIPEEDLPHLFERFFRSPDPRLRKVSGTGLGLFIVKEIVALHRGQISAASQVGRGTTIVVRLPAPAEMRGAGGPGS
jgi:two-component system phosphate regulon sensor histidine kinase PhoR